MESKTDSLTASQFVTIGDGVYLNTRVNKDATDVSSDFQHNGVQPPSVILIFGWMAAKLPHLHKYTQVYSKLYPDATQILVRSSPNFFWSSIKTRENRLTPVIAVLESLGCLAPAHPANEEISPETHSRILIHAFSNGGSYQLVTLGNMLFKRLPPPSSQIASGIILDSTPGSGNLSTTKQAFTTGVRNPLTKFLVGMLVSVLYAWAQLRWLLFGIKRSQDILKESLSNPRLVPWANKRTPRLYLYSKADALIPVKDVQGHIQVVEAAGMDVKSEMFEKSSHVQHIREDPKRYWSAVTSLWEAACTAYDSMALAN